MGKISSRLFYSNNNTSYTSSNTSSRLAFRNAARINPTNPQRRNRTNNHNRNINRNIRRRNQTKSRRVNPYLVKYNNPIYKFECCVCYNKNSSKKKFIRCNHNLCKKCYSKLIGEKKCPLCRITI